MKILSIETSCDETSAAIIEKLPDGTFQIISNVIASSQDMHAKTNGIVPERAAREQIKSILPVIQKALSDSGRSEGSINDIDAIAVTYGPGLIGSLLVGVETAKTLSVAWDKPVIPVNHLIGHIYANFISTEHSEGGLPSFPLIALVVSGGHTDLVLMRSHDEVEYLGGTVDDAAGEAFDKTARILGLPYPGGPNISKMAQVYLDKNPNKELKLFPRPMIYEKNLNWSFSGLKTAVAREISHYSSLSENEIQHLAAEIQEAIVDSLVEKSLRGLVELNAEGEIKSFLLAGGVSANARLREKFQAGITQLRDSGKLARTSFHVPEFSLCTDNAAPIGVAAFFGKSIPWQEIIANPELTITD
jgi:N6-L-threonylcarbamoyladenine synthase